MAWANGFLQDTFSFLFLCECSPAFCSANVHWFCYWVWDGKGCLGVSQDTPSVWGRRSCQPDYPLPASLRSLWLRFKQNTELKQKREGGSLNSEKRSSAKLHCWTFNSGEAIMPESEVTVCSFSALNTHTHTHTHTHTPESPNPIGWTN